MEDLKTDSALDTDEEAEDDIAPISHQSRSIPSTAFDEDALELEKINSALGLNKTLSEKLRELEKVLVGRLRECRERLADLHKASVPGERPVRNEILNHMNCGKPYFKDKSNTPAPPNEDTIIMAKRKMYDFSEITSVPGWTVKDKTSFTRLILKMSIKIKKDELTSKIAQIKREGKDIKPKKLEKEIDAVNKEIMALSRKTLKEVALPIDKEYDWDLVASTLNKRHSATEYRSLWKVYLHPDINKGIWSKSEHTLLHEIAKKYGFQDWASIAKELNTGRSGYQCFVYYRTNKNNTYTGKKWTKEEEEYLRRVVEYYKEDGYIPWGKVATAMENRTKSQIYNKYLRLAEKRKGRFVPEEDGVILACFETFGSNFKKMAEYLPGRSATQIRVRCGVLAKKRISAVWTIEEDKQLLQIMSNEVANRNFSSVSNHLLGKTRAQVRARYLTLTKWMKRHPDKSVENAPRRPARWLGHGLPTENLNKATEKLKKRIEMEMNHMKVNKITINSPLQAIEDAIIAHLATEPIKEPRKTEVDSDEEKVVLNDEDVSAQSFNIENVHKLILLLRGKLNQDMLTKSPFAAKYSELSKQKMNMLQVKSYSKKIPMTAIKVDRVPDIWGYDTLNPLTYVLPPNYATVTGCRRLMAYLSTNQKELRRAPLNINRYIRGNPAFKSQLFQLIERFNTLFVSPMLLSNKGTELIGKLLAKESKIKSGERLKLTELEQTKRIQAKKVQRKNRNKQT